MKKNESLTDAIDFFFFEILGTYRQLERDLKSMTGFKNILKPKNFLDGILQLEKLKETAQSAKITDEELLSYRVQEQQLAEKLNSCIELFLKLLECKIIINKCLEQKLNGDKSGKKQYTEMYSQAERIKKQLNREIIRLDDEYDDYTR